MGARAAYWLVLCSMVLGCGDGDVGAETDPGADAPTEPPQAGLGVWKCQPGELVLETGGCLPAGIAPRDCGVGFAPTGHQSCEPILPATACLPGNMALPGEPTCRSLAPCGSGAWGDIPVEPDTQYVDANHSGGSDGSALAPWTAIQAAVDAAADGAIVAIAEGSYLEQVTVQKRVRLWGRCPEMVEIVGPNNAIQIQQGGDGSEVRDLAITSTGVALHVGPSTGVAIDRIWIHDSQKIGIDIEGGNPSATVTRSLVESTTGIGIFGYGATITVEDTVVRDILPVADGGFGNGIKVADDDAGVPTELTVRRSVIAGTRDQGIVGFGSPLTVEDTVVRDVQPELEDGSGGQGILVYASTLDGEPSSLSVTGSFVDSVHFAGIAASDSSLVVERTVVRNVSTGGTSGASFGIGASREESLAPIQLTARSVVVEGTRRCGILTSDASGVVEAAIVRDTIPLDMPAQTGPPDVGGRGILTQARLHPDEPDTLAVRGSRVERVHEMGVAALGAELAVESTLVSGVARRDSDGLMGRGIAFQLSIELHTPASGSVRDSLVENVHDHGIAVLESSATVESTWIRDVAGAADGTLGRGIGVQGHYLAKLPAEATIRQSLVERAREVGIAVVAGDVTIDSTVVRDTSASDGGFLGDGISAIVLLAVEPIGAVRTATIEIANTWIVGSARAGVSAFAASIALGDSLLDCNGIDMNGESHAARQFDFLDLGGNRCVCADDLRTCKVSSSGLAAPDPAAP